MKKVVARIKGGLGNQLFCYAAARRLALVNEAELVVDDVTGFSRDYQYRRRYLLDKFSLPIRKATPAERLEPFERYRRALMKWWNRRKPFMERRYLVQERLEFDERLLSVKVKETLYLDGLWQSERYFKDVSETLRSELRITPPTDPLNRQISEEIKHTNAVALHVRWFDAPGSTEIYNVSAGYYARALDLIESKVKSPHYFLFSDDPDAARVKLGLPDDRLTVVFQNRGDKAEYADLWLMSLCQHFITANSTFSWWGAWLGSVKNKLVLTPNLKINGKAAWGFEGLIPDDWVIV
jgi:Glycosyl transferase family 11